MPQLVTSQIVHYYYIAKLSVITYNRQLPRISSIYVKNTTMSYSRLLFLYLSYYF